MLIQALIFSKQHFNQAQAETWLATRNKRVDDLWETNTSFRYHQRDALAGVKYFTAGVDTGIQVVMMETD
jgi:hypothetical protein